MKTGIALFFTCCCINTFAQFHPIDKAILSEIENHGVIFELLPESENDLVEIPKKKKSGKKDEEVNDYPEFNKILNAAAKRSLPKFWKISKGTVEFKTPKEIAALTFQDIKNKVFINCGWITKDTKFQGKLNLYAFEVNYINAKNEDENIFEFAYLPYEDVSDADIIFFAKTLTKIKEVSLQYEVYKDSHVFADNIKIVEAKTLLLDTAMLHKKATLEEITKVYPHKFELANRERIDKAIMEECESCMFFKPIYSVKNGMLMYDVFDTKDMKIVSAIGPGGVTLKFGGKPSTSTSWSRQFHQGSGGSGYYSYEPTTTFTPGHEVGTGGKTLWKSPLTIGAGHIRLILNEGAQKMNFR